MTVLPTQDEDGRLYEESSCAFSEPRQSFHSMSCEGSTCPRMPPIAPTQRRYEARLRHFLDSKGDEAWAALATQVAERRGP